MIANLLRPRGNRGLIEALHGRLIAAARHPALFIQPYSVPDTLDGRFDLLLLHATLMLRRLESLPDPAPEIAQDLVDAIFAHLDAGLREMGVGDLTVPKRMKKLAEAFAGRGAAYRAALTQNDDAFALALARNIYGSEAADARAHALALYARRAARQLEAADMKLILTDSHLFLDPETIDVRLR
jgi:cytochrome b pre-mRNA-processing protein 3